MKLDLILIGSELLNGKIRDLNTLELAKMTQAMGHELRKVHIIADNESDLSQSLLEAEKESDLIITSGGLGPTKDDITKQILANFFKKTIKENQEAKEVTLKQFSKTNREYIEEQFHYHKIPEGFYAIYNHLGYAPGLKYEFKKDKFIFSLPGVPSEFSHMLQDHIAPLLNQESKVTEHLIYKTWKIPESKIFLELCPNLWNDLENFGEVSSLPHFFGVDIGIKITAESDLEIQKKKNEIHKLIHQSKIQEYIWHIGPQTLEEIIIKEASEKKITFGFAESCTGGLCASKITDISGSSAVFWGSVVSYANEVKMKSLNVKETTLKEHGAVSKQTALEMAMGAKNHLGVDIAVTTTGIAGPGGATKNKPVGTVGIGVSSKNGNSSDLFYFNGNRESLKQRFCKKALMTLLEEIRKY